MLERDVTLVSGSPRAAAFQTLLVKASAPSPCFEGRGTCGCCTRGSLPRDSAGQSCSPKAQLGPLGAAAAAPGALVAGAMREK